MPLYTAGQRIRGSEINALPQLYRVTTPQICNNSATLRDVAGLAFTGDVNAAYLVECFLFCHVATTGNIKFVWSVPAGTLQADSPTQYAGSIWAAQGIALAAGSGSGSLDSRASATLTNAQARSGDAATAILIIPVAIIAIGATSGTVKLQYAQNSAVVHDTTVRANSCMRVSRLG
jgi:hypothetical protein